MRGVRTVGRWRRSPMAAGPSGRAPFPAPLLRAWPSGSARSSRCWLIHDPAVPLRHRSAPQGRCGGLVETGKDAQGTGRGKSGVRHCCTDPPRPLSVGCTGRILSATGTRGRLPRPRGSVACRTPRARAPAVRSTCSRPGGVRSPKRSSIASAMRRSDRMQTKFVAAHGHFLATYSRTAADESYAVPAFGS